MGNLTRNPKAHRAWGSFLQQQHKNPGYHFTRCVIARRAWGTGCRFPDWTTRGLIFGESDMASKPRPASILPAPRRS